MSDVQNAIRRRLARFALAVGTVLLVLAPASAQQSSYEEGITFGVGQYRRFVIGSPQACMAACQADRRCGAWTFQGGQSNSQGGQSICHMHWRVYERSSNGCCVSGVIYNRAGGYPPNYSPGPGPGPVEPYPRWQSSLFDGITFGVGNYRQFEIPGQQSAYCRDACGADPNCRAWTYQRVGYSDRGVPICHLHSYVGERTPHPCCVSGVVRRW